MIRVAAPANSPPVHIRLLRNFLSGAPTARHSTLDGPATPLSIFLETTESTYELSILAIYRKFTISVLLY